MSRVFFSLLLVAVAIVAIAVGAGPVMGQDAGNATSENATDTIPSTGEDVTIEIDGSTDVSAWEFADGSFIITISADIPRRLDITDSGAVMDAWENAEGGTSTSIPSEQYTVQRGETTIRFDATIYDEQAAITIATTGGKEFIATGAVNEEDQPVPWGTFQFAIVLTFVGTAYGTYRHVRNKADETGELEAERIV